MELDEVLSKIAADGVELVRFKQTDLHGISRSKTIPVKHVATFATAGLNFLLGQLGFDAQGGVAPGTGYLEERGFPDSKLYPDLDTYAVLPWAVATARLLCNPHFFDGAPALASPRLAMQRLCQQLADEGYLHLSGYEYELYLGGAEDRRPPFPGIQIFATCATPSTSRSSTRCCAPCPRSAWTSSPPTPSTARARWRSTSPDRRRSSGRSGVHVQEWDEGDRAPLRVYGLVHDQALRRPERLRLPPAREPGGPGDRPQRLRRRRHHSRPAVGGRPPVDRRPARPPAGPDRLLRPTVNCGKRFKQWSFAPVCATWALENRSVAIRVKALAGAALHTENRVPCGASNPYLVGAAAIAAGLDGIRNQIEPPPPTEGLAYGLDDGPTPIPTRLEAALDELEKDTTIRGLVGEELIHLFLAVKRHEIQKATERARDYTADDWITRVDEFEVAELFEFL
jgi:glutamine synthetase